MSPWCVLSCRIILETDGSIIAGKVATHNMDDGAPLSEQVMLVAFFSNKPDINEILKFQFHVQCYMETTADNFSSSGHCT